MESNKRARIKDYLFAAIGSAFGLGLSPIAPGSCGALLGILLHVSIILLLPSDIQLPALIVVFTLVCMGNNLLTPWAEEYWQEKDPKNFVLDEVAGYLFVPIFFRYGELWQVVLWGYVLFRVFDIIKIPPARQIDGNMHNAWGILLDDLVSALYAVLVMYLLWWIGPKIGAGNWLIS